MSENGPVLRDYPAGKKRRVLGLISGTSADGVDVCCVEFPASGSDLKLLSFTTRAYPEELKNRVLKASRDEMSLRETAVLNTDLGEFFAQAALSSIPPEGCDLIASHGQTVCHLPEQNTTLQLGEGSVIAKQTGVVTVNDFRPADMSLGGQGAPLVPLFDAHLLSKPDCLRIAVNLGGIANITVIPPDLEKITAWDTGPANCLSDAYCRIHERGDYDPGGETASGGTVNQELFEALLSHDFFKKPGPKSTGLEDFGQQYCLAQEIEDEFPNLLRTALAVSAHSLVSSIMASLARYPDLPVEIVFAGGGTSNLTLMKEIEERLNSSFGLLDRDPPKTLRFSDFGIPDDAREAVAFAFLGDRTVRGLYGTVPGTTGARKAAILGKISLP